MRFVIAKNVADRCAEELSLIGKPGTRNEPASEHRFRSVSLFRNGASLPPLRHKRYVILALMEKMRDDDAILLKIVEKHVATDKGATIAETSQFRHARESVRDDP